MSFLITLWLISKTLADPNLTSNRLENRKNSFSNMYRLNCEVQMSNGFWSSFVPCFGRISLLPTNVNDESTTGDSCIKSNL